MLQVVSNFSILLFTLGLDQAYVREYYESGQKPALLKAAMTPGLLLLALSLIFALSIPGAVSTILFSIDSVEISLLVAACLFANFVSRFLSLVLRMQERALEFSMSQILPRTFFLTAIASHYFLSFSFSFRYLLIAHTISIIIVTLILAWSTRKEWLATFNHCISRRQLNELLRFGLPLIIAGVAYWGLTAMDKLFLRNMSSFEELGIYSVAASFAAAGAILQSIFSTVWAPTVYRWAKEGINNEKIDQVTEYVLIAVVLLFSLAGLFSWAAAYLLPEEYERVRYILIACMAYPLFYTLSETTAIGLGITRKSGYAMLSAIVAALFNTLGNYFLVPSHGAEGAAVSTAFSFWIFFFCRTELSCLVWRKLPRFKIYTCTTICLIASIGTVFYGESFPKTTISIWGAILLIGLFLLSTVKRP